MSAANPDAGRRSRTPSANVERELVSAAEAVLVRDGPGGVTVRAVAAEAGIAPMGVYIRLGGKDGLVDALLIIGFDRLRASVEAGDEPDMLDRLRACGVRYREFALANRHFYAIMFEDAIHREHASDELGEHAEVGEHAAAAFGALVRNVEAAAAAGRIEAPDPSEVAQQIWSAVHGAVALELKGLVLTPDPEMTYRATVDTVLRGLAL
jgi:AcrR family transcriptional regulator